MNPFFKTQPKGDFSHYGAKWWEQFVSETNTFPQLHDSPLVPEDLNCLEGCFDEFKNNPALLKNVQKRCSANRLDSQIPTHVKEGNELKLQFFHL